MSSFIDGIKGVFGGGRRRRDEQQEQPSSMLNADELQEQHTPTRPPLRKKRDKEGSSNSNSNNNRSDTNYEDDIIGSVNRQLHFGARSSPNNNNTSDDGSDDDAFIEEEEEDNNMATYNPIADADDDDDDDDYSNASDDGVMEGNERVYLNDADVLHDVPVHNKHWRDMKWDPVERVFYYDKQGTPPDGIPTADANGYYFVSPTNNDVEVRVVFDQSKDIMMKGYENELKDLLERLDKMEVPKSPEGICNHLFGEQSRLMQNLVRSLGKDATDIHQFLATVYFAAELGLPVRRLQEHSYIVFDKFMDCKTLNSFWNDIAAAGKDGDEPTYLWQTVEEQLNEDCRELFLNVKGRKYKLRIALDDDKVHFQFSTMNLIKDGSYMCGLAACQHVKCNRKGFTIDSAVSAASCFPLCFRARREGSSSAQNYEFMLRYMFHLQFLGGLSSIALNNIVFCSDRGYWQVAIVLFILQYGGAVFGTIMRKEWVPFTYNQKRPGNRRVIETKYGRCVFMAFGRWCKKMMKVMAFRSGTGAVSLLFDSEGDKQDPLKFEFCLKYPNDKKWYESTESAIDRKMKAFRSIYDDDESTTTNMEGDIKYHLHMLPVLMMTCGDLDFTWYTSRLYAFTSSAAAKTINDAAPHVPQDDPVRPSYQKVIDYAGLRKKLSGPEDNVSVEFSEQDEEQVSVDAEMVRKVVQSMRAGRTEESLEQSKEDAKKILQFSSTQDDPATLVSLVMALGVMYDRANDLTTAEKKKKIKQWADSITNCKSDSIKDYIFPYDKILNARDIEQMLQNRAGDAIAKGTLPGTNKNPTKKSQRIEALEHIDNDLTFAQTAQQRDPDFDPLMYEVIRSAVKKGFLQPQSRDGKKQTKLGQQNEKKNVQQLHKDSKAGRIPWMNILDIREVGLAMKDDMPYVRDSADAIVIEPKNDDDESNGDAFDKMKSHPIECKCRTQADFDGSLRQAKMIQKKILDHLDAREQREVLGNGEAAYLQVSSSEQELLRELIPNSSERIQILHHAYTYGSNKTTFLVGGPEGNLLFGLTITFEEELLRAYGEVLKFLYNSGLNLFYEANNASELPLDLIKTIINNDETLKKKYTVDDLVLSALICKELLPGSRSKVQYPMPVCDMLVPHEHALWNVSKGGSDTVTRFTWNCLTVLPIKTPQTVMIARYLMIYAVLAHRLIQAVTGTKEADASKDTLQNVRDRANKRVSFDKTLGILREYHRNASLGPDSASVRPADNPKYQKKPAPRFDTKQKKKQFAVDHSIFGKSTGATPIGKGKGIARAKKFIGSKASSIALRRRNRNCSGKVFRMYEQGEADGKFRIDKRHACDLCKTRKVTTMCSGCKRVLCFDHDRRDKIVELLESDDGDRLREEYPALSNLRRRDAPPYYTEAGVVNKKKYYLGSSCWHIAHQHSPCDDMDDQLSHVAASGEGIDSPQAL